MVNFHNFQLLTVEYVFLKTFFFFLLFYLNQNHFLFYLSSLNYSDESQNSVSFGQIVFIKQYWF